MEPTMGLTFEKVWAMFEDIAERMKETDRQMQETSRQMKETDKKLQETDRQIGKLGSRLGDLIEELIMPNIVKKFNALGYVFTKASQHTVYKSLAGNILAEVDVLVENGDYALVVEVKTTPNSADVKDHIKRMETLRAYANEHNDNRKYIGAIAGGIMHDNVRQFAQDCGFFVMEQSGETACISPAPKDWKPKEW